MKLRRAMSTSAFGGAQRGVPKGTSPHLLSHRTVGVVGSVIFLSSVELCVDVVRTLFVVWGASPDPIPFRRSPPRRCRRVGPRSLNVVRRPRRKWDWVGAAKPREQVRKCTVDTVQVRARQICKAYVASSAWSDCSAEMRTPSFGGRGSLRSGSRLLCGLEVKPL